MDTAAGGGAGRNVAGIRRDRLYKADGKLDTAFVAKGDFVAGAVAMLGDIQTNLHAEAKARLDGNIRRDVTDLAAHFSGDDKFVGWVEVQWSRPTGAVLDGIVEQLKALKLTMRNTPLDATPTDGACFFTGEPAVERVLIGRTYCFCSRGDAETRRDRAGREAAFAFRRCAMPHRALWRVACRPKRTPPRLRGSARTIWTTPDEKAQVATRTSLARPDSPLYRGQSVGGRPARACPAFRAARRERKGGGEGNSG